MQTAVRQGLEALLFLADEPVPAGELAEALELEPGEVEDACQQLADSYRAEERGLAVRRAGGGWRMYTAEPAWPVVERHVLTGRTGRLSSAALETLAVVAYKQPITRSGVGEIRGVNADAAIRSLVARGYLEEVGQEETPGQPLLYGTTGRFLEDLGLDTLEELPDLADHLPEDGPDEPDDVRAARELLQRGGSLEGDESADTSGARPGDEAEARARREAADRRAQDDAAMADLSTRLETAARSAMDQLREAVAAREAVEEGEDPAAMTSDVADAADADDDRSDDTQPDEDGNDT